jgi:hypothetical protein
MLPSLTMLLYSLCLTIAPRREAGALFDLRAAVHKRKGNP